MEKRKVTLLILVTLIILTLIAIFATVNNENVTGKVIKTYQQARIDLVSRYLPPEIMLEAGIAEQYGNMNIKVVDHDDWAQIVTITDVKNLEGEILVGIGGKVFSLERQGNNYVLEKVNVEDLMKKTQIEKQPQQTKPQPKPTEKEEKKDKGILDRIFGW